MRGGDVNQNLTVKDTILDVDLGLSYDFFEKHQDYNNKKIMLPLPKTQNDFVKCKTKYKTFLIPKTSLIQCNNNDDIRRLATKIDEIDEIEWSE
jgi:hypothetical protein